MRVQLKFARNEAAEASVQITGYGTWQKQLEERLVDLGRKKRSNISRDRQRNATLRRVSATTVTVEKRHVVRVVCVCSLCYPACNARAPYCHLWLAPNYDIFPYYLIKDIFFFN
jgi:hypothetical protein